MSTRLGSLTLDLIARIGNFTGPIRDAERQTESSFANMRKHVNTYGLAVAGAAAGAVTALATMALETSNQAAELEIFAFRANTTTQEFQKMAVGAAAFGVEGDKLSDMMKDFNEKMGELTAIGAGGGVDFFEKIAMKTEGSSEAAKKLILDMQKLSGPEALQMYVDKLEEAGATQEQMSFYLESMASDLTDLYPLLANGGEGLRLYGDMAERAGIIMTDQTKEAALALKDQVYMLDLQLQGAKNQLMQAVIPAFVDVADAFLGGSEQGLQFSEVADGIAESLRFVAKMAIGVVTNIQLAGKAMGAMGAVYGSIQSNKDWYELGPLGYAKALFDARGEIASIGKSYVSDANEMLLEAAEKMDAIDKRAGSSKANQLRGIREIQQNIKQTNGGLSELADKQNEVAKATKENNKAQQELNKLLEQQAQARKSILYAYADQEKQIQLDLNDEINKIREANFPDPDKYLEAANRKAYLEKQIYLSQLQYEINEFNLTEEQKLKYKTEINQLMIQADLRLTEENREIKLKALDEQYALELQKAKFHAQNMRQAMQEGIMGLAGDADNIFAQATMSPQDYDRWSLENDRSNAKAGLKNQRVGVEQDIMTSDSYSTDDERYEALLEAHKEYRDGMAAIDVDYHQRVKDLEVQNYEDKLEVYGMLLSQAGTVWGTMTQMVKDSAGEQSGAYKTMFFMQQAIAIGQAVISTELAAVKALELGPILGIPASTLVRGMGYASVGLIAAQTISGMAHDGIDNIPKEGTWLLDKGERVVDSRTNGDLKDMIANQKSGGGDVHISVQVTDSGVSTQSNQSDQKQLGQMIGNAVRTVIRQEQRQGGLLSK